MAHLSVIDSIEHLEAPPVPENRSMPVLTPDVADFLLRLTDNEQKAYGQLPDDYPDYGGEAFILRSGHKRQSNRVGSISWYFQVGPDFKSRIDKFPRDNNQSIVRLQVARTDSATSEYADAKPAEVMMIRMLLGQIAANTERQ